MIIIHKIVLKPVSAITVQQTTPKLSHLKQKFIISQSLRVNGAQLGSSYLGLLRWYSQMAAEPGVT